MTPADFIHKWQHGGKERPDAQSFFNDVCALVGHKTPREADPDHSWFTFEYGATKTSGGEGWADVWKKGYFGWEAKGTHKSLERAYEQLKMYADALQNPPLLVVTDLQTIVIHTNFTNTIKREYRFTVADLAQYETRQLLEAVFHAPERLKPGTTRAAVTQEAADKFTQLATALRARGHEASAVAHFLNRLLFCMFAEDIGLLPGHLFTKLVQSAQGKPQLFEQFSRELFGAMHKGGHLAFESVEWFNGGLFENDSTLPLDAADLKLLLAACKLDWSEIEPSVFGTLFERGLDPDKRSQLGAHYTDPETIMKIVRPVVIEPWLAAWEAEKAALAKLMGKSSKRVSKAAQTRFNQFLERLRAFTVLDPACGSGNFLYLALRALKDTEKRVLIEAEMLGLGRQFPDIGPRAVKGIELNPYAAELARVTIWIGEIQWMISNGYGAKKNPILQPLDQIECRDALLDFLPLPPAGEGRGEGAAPVREAQWPTADVVIGNPPFVGDKKMIRELGEAYVKALRSAYQGRVPGGADLVCYWFEKANDALKAGGLLRVGLVTTNSIRGGKNREVLKHICEHGRIFNAWGDEEWVNEGAAVRVSLVCFEGSDLPAPNLRHSRESGSSDRHSRESGNPEHSKRGTTPEASEQLDSRFRGNDSVFLDGQHVSAIFADLSAAQVDDAFDVTQAKPLATNAKVCFQGTGNVGPFDVDDSVAQAWLKSPNPHGKSNAEVLRLFANGSELTKRARDRWVVDFGTTMTEQDAALFEQPFSYVAREVKPLREPQRRKEYKEIWWRHAESRPAMRVALAPLKRFVATPKVSKHRLFTWLDSAYLPNNTVLVVARDDDAAFGILCSRVHELWALKTCTWMGVGNDPQYTPKTCFETFPFPEGLTPNIPAADYASDPRAQRIAEAAQQLVQARDRWLNPTEWTDRVPEVVAGYPDRILPKPGFEAELKKRTLTNLYNARPAWLDHLHRTLDEAVAAAYGWPWPLTDDELLRRLFALNQARS